MKKISSDFTFVYIKILPIGFLILLIQNILDFPSGLKEKISHVLFLTVACLIFKYYVIDLIDEVYDCGKSLLFKKGNKEIEIELKNIKKVNYKLGIFTNYQYLGFEFHERTEIGKKDKFIPTPFNWFGLIRNPEMVDLIKRIEAAHSK